MGNLLLVQTRTNIRRKGCLLTVVQKKWPKQERILLDIHQKELELVVNKRNTHCKGWHGYLEGWPFITETWGGRL